MLTQTLEALEERIRDVELELGLDQQGSRKLAVSSPISSHNSNNFDITELQHPSVMAQIAELQAKVNLILKKYPELQSIPTILKEYGKELDTCGKVDEPIELLSQAEKQERLSARLRVVIKYVNEVTELLSLELPEIPGGLIEALDLDAISTNENRIRDLAQLYEILVLKNILILNRFMALIEKEARFWKSADARLKDLNSKVASIPIQP